MDASVLFWSRQRRRRRNEVVVFERLVLLLFANLLVWSSAMRRYMKSHYSAGHGLDEEERHRLREDQRRPPPADRQRWRRPGGESHFNAETSEPDTAGVSHVDNEMIRREQPDPLLLLLFPTVCVCVGTCAAGVRHSDGAAHFLAAPSARRQRHTRTESPGR